MTLGNMRELGVHHLIAFCLNDACRHMALIDVSSYPAETYDRIGRSRRAARARPARSGREQTSAGLH